LAVAWEGAGVARAARLHEVDFLEIRALTDGADENTMAHFQENLASAMDRIARLLIPE
jgi:adenosylhomocysteine nucleosidase